MEKCCVICGQKIETRMGVNTEKFIVNFEPCICSDCAMILFDSLCEKDSMLSEYKEGISNFLETIVFNYPDDWSDELQKYLVGELIKIKSLVGQHITENEAIQRISNVKKAIDKDPEKYSSARKIIRSSKGSSSVERTTDILPIQSHIVVLQTTDSEEANNRKRFRSIVNTVKEMVRGQDEAVESIGRLLFHNQQCIEYNRAGFMGPKIVKQNMILVGPSGTGKTATITEYCKLLKLPYVIADMTAYTQAGYHGADIESIFTRLIDEAGGNIELAQKGIVIMDEGDKNESKERHGDVDVGGKGVIDSLLKKIEGTDIDLGKHGIFNSTNTTFITMGVYPRLYDIRKERMIGKKSIGFSASHEEIKDYGEFIADDFINHGFSQEYVGRFSNIVELKPLSDEAYLDILRNSKNSAYKQYKALFDYSFGIELIITPEGELSIVEQSKKYNIGARGLQRCMAKILEGIEKRIMLEEFKCEKIVIDKDCEVKII